MLSKCLWTLDILTFVLRDCPHGLMITDLAAVALGGGDAGLAKAGRAVTFPLPLHVSGAAVTRALSRHVCCQLLGPIRSSRSSSVCLSACLSVTFRNSSPNPHVLV